MKCVLYIVLITFNDTSAHSSVPPPPPPPQPPPHRPHRSSHKQEVNRNRRSAINRKQYKHYKQCNKITGTHPYPPPPLVPLTHTHMHTSCDQVENDQSTWSNFSVLSLDASKTNTILNFTCVLSYKSLGYGVMNLSN